MKHRCLITITFILLVLVSHTRVNTSAQTLQSEAEVILLRADPEVIVADGQSSSTITAEVRDRTGALVPDGTLVRFTTTNGLISQSMTTRSGVVRVNLRSSAEEGIAEVTASSGTRAIGRVQVTFSAEAMPAQQMKPFVRVDAQSIHYIPEKGLIDAAGNVHVSYRGLSVEAELLQIECGAMRLKARNNVVLKIGKNSLNADLLSMEMQNALGSLVALDTNGTIRRQRFSGYKLQTQNLEEQLPEDTYLFTEWDNAKAIMTARKLTYFPGEKLQFSHFGLRVGDTQIVKLPFYVLSLNPYSEDADQYFSLDSIGGLSVNLPFYYNVSDYSNGSLRLRKQSRYSYDGYDTRPGWQLALNQRYYFGQSNNGEVELNHITSSDWGARWRHEQLFGSSTHTYLSLDSPTHKDLYARAELYHSMSMGDLSLSTYGSMLPDVPTTMQSRLYFRMKPGKIKKPNISYYWSTNIGWSYYGSNSYVEPGIDLQVIPAAVKLGKATNLQFNMGSGYSITQSGTGPTAQASASLIRRIGHGSNASLRYSYYYSGRTSEYFGATSSQSITGQLYMGGSKRWNSALTATYMPNSDNLALYGSLIYSPIRNWRLELRPTFYSYGGSGGIGNTTTTNLDIYLAHQIGGRDVALRWSTLDNRIRLELGTTALRF